MRKIERTETEKRINKRKNTAYSSLYSIASFLASFAYLIADIVFDNRISAMIAFAILGITLVVCEVGIRKLRKAIEADDERAANVCSKFEYHAQTIGYLSYILLAVSLIVAMFI